MNDYIKTIKNGLSNITGVSRGWYNVVKSKLGKLTIEQQEIIEKRINICLECPFNSINAKTNLGYKSDLSYEHCSSCNCPIDAKPFDLNDDCGLKWFIFHSDDDSVKHIKEYYMNHNEPIELKWKSV
jgi:hypothetical protein